MATKFQNGFNTTFVGDDQHTARKAFEVRRVRHVFVDVVAFSHNRSVEAQSEIVFTLNQLFRGAAKSLGNHEVIYLPTGDGICACFLQAPDFDTHLRFALKLLEFLADHNEDEKDEMRRFELRIALNENLDNIVQDINDKKNVAGGGITLAQRIMGLADGCQVLLSEAVHDTLRYREDYMNAFKRFQAVVKHGVELPVYQLIMPQQRGLNTEIPRAFHDAKAA